MWKGLKTQYGIITDILPSEKHAGFGLILTEPNPDVEAPNAYYICLDDLRWIDKCQECGKEHFVDESHNPLDHCCSFECFHKISDRKLKELAESGDLERYWREMQKEEEIEKSVLLRHIEYFHKKHGTNPNPFIEKVLNKYESDSYKDRWYGRGIEPEEALSWFLFSYAERYGTPCYEKEYLNMFTGEAYYLGSYVIQVMHGQGSVIRIDKVKETTNQQ